MGRGQSTALAALLLTGCAMAAPGPPTASLADGRTGTIAFRTMTMKPREFLMGEPGVPVVVTGELNLPEKGGPRVPVAVLMHGAGGVQDYHYQWARELRSIGVGTFIVDSFSGRGVGRIHETAEGLEAVNIGSRIIDAYRGLDLLATHPRVDRERIVLMGFSHGAAATLHATYLRFQRSYLTPGLEYAAYLPFYAFCNTRVIDDDKLSRRPVRLFHGAADDYTPLGPCRAWVDRAKAAGADAEIREYPLTYHAFDNPRLPAAFRNHHALNPSRCFYAERTRGEVVNAETGQPLTYHDPCWGRGVTVGYEPRAYADALASVKAFLKTAIAAGR
jgi:dienelactone hydrolase